MTGKQSPRVRLPPGLRSAYEDVARRAGRKVGAQFGVALAEWLGARRATGSRDLLRTVEALAGTAAPIPRPRDGGTLGHPVHVSLPPEAWETYEALAAEDSRTLSSQVRVALEEWLLATRVLDEHLPDRGHGLLGGMEDLAREKGGLLPRHAG